MVVAVVLGAVLDKICRANPRIGEENPQRLVGLLDGRTIGNRQTGGRKFRSIHKIHIKAQVDVRGVDLLQNFAAARLDAILLNLWHANGANVVFCQDNLLSLVHAAGADVEQVLRQQERGGRPHGFIQSAITQSQTGSQRHTMDVVGFGGEVSVDVGVGIDPDNAELVSGDAAG